MASKKLLCFLIVYFFALGSATYCNDDSDCYNSESCCSDKVCRQKCYYCSYDYQCGTNEQCCNNKCTSSSSTSSCSYDYQCQISEQCCNSKCISSSSSCTCSYDYQCGSSKKCCNGKCISSLSSCSCSYDYQCGSSKKCCNSKCIGSSSSCYCTYDSDCDIILWLEWRSYCRRYYWHNYILRHHHFHCVLSLLCLLPVLPLSYIRYCGRHRPTATTTNGLNSHTLDDATSTSSSAGELQSASSSWLQPASSRL